MKNLTPVLAGAVVGAGLTLGSMIASVAHPTQVATPVGDTFTPVVPATVASPCVEEDSVNCTWDATALGNGVGHSFIVRQVPHSDLVCRFYVNVKDARRWDSCEARP